MTTSTAAFGENEGSFWRELTVYVRRMSLFTRRDWAVYVAWVGLMLGLVLSTGGFLILGHARGVSFPAEAWLVPFGALVFTLAIAVDTIGHLTIYKEEIKHAERLVHHVTIACGISSCVLLCAGYTQRESCMIPALVTTVLSFVYSLIDEAFHWRRYLSRESDRVEMWSHLFILVGHGTMMLAWWQWFYLGYDGVAHTIAVLRFD
jgi:hypothetical protein